MKQQVQIVIPDNKYCIIKSDDYELLRAIDNQFSFRLTGSEFIPSVKSGRWDGVNHLLIRRNDSAKLPLGLLDRLKTFLTTIDYSALIEDKRFPVIPALQIDISGKLAQLGMDLRDYQQMIVDKAFSKRKGIVRAATGSGKSVVIAALIAKINKPACIYIVGLDLLNQFYTTMASIFDEPIGYIGNGDCRIERLNVVSVWSAGKALGLKNDIIDDDSTDREIMKVEHTQSIVDLLKRTSVHVLDECHYAGCSTIKELFKVIDPERIYGFSATPTREDNSDLQSYGILGDIIVNVNASELIAKGYLAQPNILFVPVPKQKTVSNDYHSIYRDYIVENEQRNKLVVEHTKKLLAKGYKTLVLFRQIRHGQILQEMFADSGVEIEMLSGEDTLERREEIKQRMIDGKLQAILSSSIFDTGIDLPILSGLVMASAGKARGRSLQKIGRTIRKYPGKTNVAIIDFADDAKYLKQHSQKRYETYKSEDGFIVKWSKEK